MDSFRTRYHDDAKLHDVVNAIVRLLETSAITVPDLAKAATLAAQIYAERHGVRTILVIREEAGHGD